MPTNFISEEEKEGKASIWSCVQLVTLLKIEDAMFSIIKTSEGITNLPITNHALLSNFWISGFTRFFAPPRTAPRILTLALPRRKMLRPAHPCWVLIIIIIGRCSVSSRASILNSCIHVYKQQPRIWHCSAVKGDAARSWALDNCFGELLIKWSRPASQFSSPLRWKNPHLQPTTRTRNFYFAL